VLEEVCEDFDDDGTGAGGGCWDGFGDEGAVPFFLEEGFHCWRQGGGGHVGICVIIKILIFERSV